VVYFIMTLTQLEWIKTELKRKDMEKTRLEDLFVINYRSQEVAEEICKTH
jgi:hypothetical protein